MRQEWDEKSIRRRRSFKVLFSRRDTYLKREVFFRKNMAFWFALSIESTATNHISYWYKYFYIDATPLYFQFSILYDLNVFYDFFQYIILNQLRLEEVTVGERFSGFRQPLSQIVDPDPQDQTLRHFSYQIFIFMRPLFTKYCADLTKISGSNFVCGVDLKCCYSN